MMRQLLIAASTAVTIIAYPSAAMGAQAAPEIDALLKEIGGAAIRQVGSDIAFPADAAEYEALGKNAVLMLSASTAISTELPLRAAYLEVSGVRVPLQRLALFPSREAERNGETYNEQVSFYLVPISLLKKASELGVDFRGERRSFSVMHFSATGPDLGGAPSFVRLDEYDSPSEPDEAAVEALLSREYPQFFPN